MQRVIPLFFRVKNFITLRSNLFSSGHMGALILLIFLVIVFLFVSPTFRKVENLTYLAKNGAITIGLVALGQTVVMISGGIDLSVSSVIALTGLIAAWLVRYGFGPIPPLTGNFSYLAILISWLVGALIGAAQGWLITKCQIPPFIVTLATMLGLRGITIGISSAIVYGLPTEFRWVSEGTIGVIPMPFVIMLVVYVITAYMLRKTKIGRYCYAIGGNETATRLAGVDVNRYRIYFYAYCSLLAAMTGTLLISHLNVAIYSHGDGYQFSSVAAAIIGGTSLTGGLGGVWGSLIGVSILAIIPSGLIMLDVPSWTRDVVIAITIILAVIIDVNRSRARKKEIQIEASQNITSSHYLNDILRDLARNIEKYSGINFCRMYLVDRDSGELVPHEMISQENNTILPMVIAKSPIALEALKTGSAVLIQDIARSGFQRVKLMNPEVQSSLALPLFNQETCFGVVELQCPGVGTLKESTITALADLISPYMVSLEDAWLSESGWLIRQIRDALRHLWDDLYLSRLALADWALPISENHKKRLTGLRGQALRELLIKTIGELKPEENQVHTARNYRILQMTYVEELAIEQIISTLHISRRQYFYDLKSSVEILTDLLARNHH